MDHCNPKDLEGKTIAYVEVRSWKDSFDYEHHEPVVHFTDGSTLRLVPSRDSDNDWNGGVDLVYPAVRQLGHCPACDKRLPDAPPFRCCVGLAKLHLEERTACLQRLLELNAPENIVDEARSLVAKAQAEVRSFEGEAQQ